LKGEDSWELLAELKRRPQTRDIPVVVVTTVKDEGKAIALGADAYCEKPVDRQRLVQTLNQLVLPESMRRVLVVDDEEVFRYVLRQLMAPHHIVSEAGSGSEAIQRARAERPDVICLDLGMPDVDGTEVLRRLRGDPATSGIPVVVVTSRPLEEGQLLALRELSAEVLAKNAVTRESALAAVEAALRSSQRSV